MIGPGSKKTEQIYFGILIGSDNLAVNFGFLYSEVMIFFILDDIGCIVDGDCDGNVESFLLSVSQLFYIVPRLEGQNQESLTKLFIDYPPQSELLLRSPTI